MQYAVAVCNSSMQ